MSRNSFVIALAVVGLSTAVLAQVPKSIDYDSLCKLDKSGARRYAFMNTTPESRAEMMKTHIARFRDVYRGGLTSAQYAHIGEWLAIITPEMYSGGPAAEQARQKAQRLSHEMPKLFTMEQMKQMSVVDGNCVAANPK